MTLCKFVNTGLYLFLEINILFNKFYVIRELLDRIILYIMSRVRIAHQHKPHVSSYNGFLKSVIQINSCKNIECCQ